MEYKVAEIEFHFARFWSKAPVNYKALIERAWDRERDRDREREGEEKMRDGALSVNSMRAFIVSEQFWVKYFVVIFMENPTLCNLIHAWDGSWLVKLEFVIWNYNTLIFDPSRVTNAPFVPFVRVLLQWVHDVVSRSHLFVVCFVCDISLIISSTVCYHGNIVCGTDERCSPFDNNIVSKLSDCFAYSRMVVVYRCLWGLGY